MAGEWPSTSSITLSLLDRGFITTGRDQSPQLWEHRAMLMSHHTHRKHRPKTEPQALSSCIPKTSMCPGKCSLSDMGMLSCSSVQSLAPGTPKTAGTSPLLIACCPVGHLERETYFLSQQHLSTANLSLPGDLASLLLQIRE